MQSVERNRSWLACFLDLAQQPEAERESSVAEVTLRRFAQSLAPSLIVDWDAESPSAPESNRPVIVMKRRKSAPPPQDALCVECGRVGVYQTKPNRWNRTGSWYCDVHESPARQREAEDAESSRLLRDLRAANPAQVSATPTAGPRDTDSSAVLREVLTGLNSFLNHAEWTFPPLRLTPTITLGSGKRAKPERHAIGSLRDVVLTGLSDLLIGHGPKVRRCRAAKCKRAFVAVKRQAFCRTTCASNARSDRFQKRLGKEGFKERRHRYYEKTQRRITGNPNLRVGRREPKGRTR
jgi:hypothetical protein